MGQVEDARRSALRRALKGVLLGPPDERLAVRAVWMDGVRDLIRTQSERAATEFDELSPRQRHNAAALIGPGFGLSFDAFCGLARQVCEQVAIEFPEVRERLSRIDWDSKAGLDLETDRDEEDTAPRFEAIEGQLCKRLPWYGREYASAKVRLRLAPDGRIISHEVCAPLPEPRFCDDIMQAIDSFRIGSERLSLAGIASEKELSSMLETGIIVRMESEMCKQRGGVVFGKKALDDMIWSGLLLSLLSKG